MTKAILAQFEAATKEFCALAKAVPIKSLHFAPAPGEWPPAFVIHHLADCDAHFMVRFLNILSEENPRIVPFNEESFPDALQYEGRSIAVSLSTIEALSTQLVNILSQLPDESWNRTGLHDERGKISLSDVLQTTTNHRMGHLDQIRQ